MNDGAKWLKSRQIAYRIELEGALRLTSPAHFGNGEAGEEVDMPLLRDPLTGAGLLTGPSLAGALRNYLWECEFGYGVMPQAALKAHRESLAAKLFGGLRQDDEGVQSALIVDDALAENAASELRDGVRIDPTTRTAADTAKFDFELLQAGVIFKVHFELLISAGDDGRQLRKALGLALQGLEKGVDITLGARKKRGFGACQIVEWQVRELDLGSVTGLLGWLNRDGQWQSGPQIMALLYPDLAPEQWPCLQERRRRCDLHATFAIAPDSSLLIRGIQGALEAGPDAMHIHRPELNSHGQAAAAQPIIPGTSWAGVIRGQAHRIAKSLHGNDGADWVNQIFGGVNEEAVANQDKYTGSRAEFAESVLTGVGEEQSMVVNRIAIDRFTGGVLDNLLFDEMPLFGGPTTRLELWLRLRNPTPAEVGLLLQVLKDLWIGDLVIGGGAAIGRGRLQGLEAEVDYYNALAQMSGDEEHEDGVLKATSWRLLRPVGATERGVVRLAQGALDELQQFGMALTSWKKAAQQEGQDA